MIRVSSYCPYTHSTSILFIAKASSTISAIKKIVQDLQLKKGPARNRGETFKRWLSHHQSHHYGHRWYRYESHASHGAEARRRNHECED